MGEGRLRFEEFGFQRLPNGRCRAKVVLGWADGRRFEGVSDGVTSQTGELRCCAVAAVQALERSVETKLVRLSSVYTQDDPKTWEEIKANGDAAIIGVGH